VEPWQARVIGWLARRFMSRRRRIALYRRTLREWQAKSGELGLRDFAEAWRAIDAEARRFYGIGTGKGAEDE
jgi:hypothetical protein